MTWVIINIIASTLVTGLASYLLGVYGHRFNHVERFGLGLMGAGSFLTIGPILTRHMPLGISPYDDWSAALLRVGCALVLIGAVARIEGIGTSPHFPSSGR